MSRSLRLIEEDLLHRCNHWRMVAFGLHVLHILPKDDVFSHTERPLCPCGTQRDYVMDGVVYLHRAWDGRGLV